jgi:hypothetical protein
MEIYNQSYELYKFEIQQTIIAVYLILELVIISNVKVEDFFIA